MNDKIIINGVVVSECSNYDHYSYFECENVCCHCDEIPNCYFKQLARVKQELQAKEQECEELKHDLQSIQHNCTREGCKYYDDNTYKVFYNCKGKTELSKYKQALDEIEKIVDNGTADTQTNNAKWLHEYYLARFCDIREIINKAKDK